MMQLSDRVTGGIVREEFLEKVKSILAKMCDDVHPSIIMFNIMDFQSINEIYGQQFGDHVLSTVYSNIRNSNLSPICMSRLDSDHFACLVDELHLNYNTIKNLCSLPLECNGHKFKALLYCGIYNITDTAMPVETMCSRARTAAKNVIDIYNNPCMVYNEKMHKKLVAASRALENLEQALINEEFKAYYQPIVDAKTGEIVMAEALVRWKSEKFGEIMPGEFIPVLEKYGGLSKVDMQMTRQVIRMLDSRKEQHKKFVPIDINISWKDLTDSSAVEMLKHHIRTSTLPKNSIGFEITESSIMELSENSRELLDIFNQYDIKISIDDFGQGYSSNTMCGVNFSTVKFDRELIWQINRNPKVNTLMETLFTMFHKMGAKVVAEGVENQEQAQFLLSINCDYIQGYYYYRPMPEEEFLKILDSADHPEPEPIQQTVSHDIKIHQISSFEWDELSATQKILHKIIRKSETALYIWDSATGIIHCPDEFTDIWNEEHELHNFPDNGRLMLYSDDDYQRFVQLYKRSMDGEPYGENYFRGRQPNGKRGFSWCKISFYTIYDDRHKPYKTVFSSQDCTEELNKTISYNRREMLIREQDISLIEYFVSNDSLRYMFRDSDGNIVTKFIENFTVDGTISSEGDIEDVNTIFINAFNNTPEHVEGFIDFVSIHDRDVRMYYRYIFDNYHQVYGVVAQIEELSKTRDALMKTIKQQQEYISITNCLRNVYSIIMLVDLSTNTGKLIVTFNEFDSQSYNLVDSIEAHTRFCMMYLIKPRFKQLFKQFVDMSTVRNRIKNKKMIQMDAETSFGWMRFTLLPSALDLDGKPTMMMFLGENIQDEKHYIDYLTHAAEYDQLTGIRNRYGATKEISGLLNKRQPGFFTVLDVDHFKAVNDNFGHQVGDKVLIAIASCFYDDNRFIVFRLGGDEYGGFMPTNAPIQAYTEENDGFFQKVDNIRIPEMGCQKVSVSMGAVFYDGTFDTDFDELYREADKLLYLSKQHQGNYLTIQRIQPKNKSWLWMNGGR